MYFNFDMDSISRHVHFNFLSRRLNHLHKYTLTTYSQEKTVWNSFESIMVKQRIQCSRITDFYFSWFIVQFYSDWVLFVGFGIDSRYWHFFLYGLAFFELMWEQNTLGIWEIFPFDWVIHSFSRNVRAWLKKCFTL